MIEMIYTDDISPNTYHGCAHELEPDDKRLAKYQEQRQERGFDDTETWNLQITIARFALPRLKRFKEVNNGFPHDMTEEAWDAALDEMIFALEAVAEDGDWNWPTTPEQHIKSDRVAAGIKLFGERFLHLWW